MSSQCLVSQVKNGFLRTNERRSQTIKTIMLPKLARLVNPGMIGSCEIYYGFKIKARSLGSVTIAIRLLGKNLFELVFFLENSVHFLSTWLSLPMFANFKLVSVRD